MINRDQVPSVEIVSVPVSGNLAASIVNELESNNIVPADDSSKVKAWRFSSLSCIATDFADGASGGPHRSKECTFEAAGGEEFKVSTDFASSRISELAQHNIRPLAGSSGELQFYSVEDFGCVATLPSRKVSCAFLNKSALFSES